MGHRRGAVNYKNKVLIKIIGKILPNGEYGWQEVAIAYQDATKEETSRNTTNLKKQSMQQYEEFDWLDGGEL